MRKDEYLIQDYLDAAMDFYRQEFENEQTTPDSTISKNNLQGKKLNLDVYRVLFENTPGKSTYALGVDGKIFAAGSMHNADDVIKEISETYKTANPEKIFLRFPAKIPASVSQVNKNYFGEVVSKTLPVLSCDIPNFQKRLNKKGIITIAQETSKS